MTPTELETELRIVKQKCRIVKQKCDKLEGRLQDKNAFLREMNEHIMELHMGLHENSQRVIYLMQMVETYLAKLKEEARKLYDKMEAFQR